MVTETTGCPSFACSESLELVVNVRLDLGRGRTGVVVGLQTDPDDVLHATRRNLRALPPRVAPAKWTRRYASRGRGSIVMRFGRSPPAWSGA